MKKEIGTEMHSFLHMSAHVQYNVIDKSFRGLVFSSWDAIETKKMG